MQSVVVMGAPACGKTAVWLGLAAALGAGALRLEAAAGADGGGAGGDALAWPVARARFAAATARHGVRVAHILVPNIDAGQTWPLALRLVDGPGVDPATGATGGPEMARLLRELLAADLLVHVVSEPGGAVDTALGELAQARRIALEAVFVVRGGARAAGGSPRLRLMPDGAAFAQDARALAQRVRRRLGPPARRPGLRWPPALS
jgi:hypothetical protein